jgi:hypothetical protein
MSIYLIFCRISEAVCVFSFTGEVCQQGLFSPATASIREGELKRMDLAPRGISGAFHSCSLGEAAELLNFHFCSVIARQM